MDVNHTKVVKYPNVGNGLAASKDFKVGDPIIKISEPYLIVAEKDALERVCSYCFIESEDSSLKRCTACKISRYCSSACQKADWQLIHKKECSILQKLPGIPPTPVRALVQMILRYLKPSYQLDTRSANLEYHYEELRTNEQRMNKVMLQAKAAQDWSKSPDNKLDLIVRILLIMATNAFRATLPDDTPIGLCYEPTLALANHSCMPNAFIMFDGRNVSLIALNEIKADEQIFISYIDFTQALYMRQEALTPRYFFTCKCEKCKHDYNAYQTFQKTPVISLEKMNLFCNYQTLSSKAVQLAAVVPNALADLDKSQREGMPRSSYENSKELSTSLEHLNKPIKGSTALQVTKKHQVFALAPFPATMDELYLKYIDSGQLTGALILLLFIFLNCDVYNWPQPNHPVRVTRLFTIAKLLKYAASLEPAGLAKSLPFISKDVLEGIDCIDATHAVLILVLELAPLSHGKGTRLARQVEEEMREVEEVQRLRGGGTGEILKKWQGGSSEGAGLASQIFAKLRALSEFAFVVIEKQEV